MPHVLDEAFSAMGRAVGAQTIQREFVVFDDKAVFEGGSARQIQRAHVQVEDVFAPATLEMFVMPAFGGFKPRLARRQNHALDLPTVLQQFQGAINCGQTGRRVFAARSLVNFGNGQRSIGLGDDAKNRVPLARLALA